MIASKRKCRFLGIDLMLRFAISKFERQRYFQLFSLLRTDGIPYVTDFPGSTLQKHLLMIFHSRVFACVCSLSKFMFGLVEKIFLVLGKFVATEVHREENSFFLFASRVSREECALRNGYIGIGLLHVQKNVDVKKYCH